MRDLAINEMSADEQRLNHWALLSIIGWDRDWQAHLVTLLRSGAPIGRAVREELADAIDGTSCFGARLMLSGHERSSRWHSSVKDRLDWFECGAQVAPYVNEANNLPEGIENAAADLGRAEAYCKKAYYYRRGCELWMAEARKRGKYYAQMSLQQLSLEFHIASVDQNTSKPIPKGGPEFDEWMDRRLVSLRELAGPLTLGGWQSEALLQILFWIWRVPTSKE